MVGMTVSSPPCPICICGRKDGDITLSNGNLAGTVNKFKAKQEIDKASRGGELIMILQKYYGYDISSILESKREIGDGELPGVCKNVLSVTNKKIKEIFRLTTLMMNF